MALFAEFFGGTPKVPDFNPIDPLQSQRAAVSGNISTLPDITKLADRVNTFNQQQWDKALEAALPGYGNQKNQIAKNLDAWNRGEIPQDVTNLVQNNAAYKALGGGYAGSGAQRNLVGRDLGLTSLDIMDKGLQATERWLQTTRNPNMFDASSMFVTPAQRMAFDVEERNAKFQHDYVKNQWDWYGSFGQQMVRFEDTAVQLASSIAGGMMGG